MRPDRGMTIIGSSIDRVVSMRRNNVMTAMLSLSVIAGALLPTPAAAIPMFSRKYGLGCTTCHEMWPRLNEFGQQFQDNGYRLNQGRDNPVMQPGTYWPISMRTIVGYQFTAQTQVPVAPTANNPNGLATTQTGTFGFSGLDIQTAGTLGDTISFVVMYSPALASAGFSTMPSDGDLEKAAVIFNRLFGTPYLNVRVGKYELDLPVNQQRTLTLTQVYNIYFFRAQGSIVTFTPGESQAGVQVYGHSELSRLRYSLSLVTANGTSLFSANVVSNPVLWGHVQAYQLLGGNILTGIKEGAFGSVGWQPTRFLNSPTGTDGTPGAPVSGTGSNLAPYYRAGGEIHFQFISTVDPLWVTGVVMYGSDSAGLINGGTRAAEWFGGFAQASYVWSPAWALTARYERIVTLQQGSDAFSHAEGNLTAWVASLRYAVDLSSRAGLAFQAEVSQVATTTAGLPAGVGPPLGTTILLGVDFAY